tara:strand:+ start:1752 stop:1955 length:204 start_codon:yes stop_codon:yes gene_type:complete
MDKLQDTHYIEKVFQEILNDYKNDSSCYKYLNLLDDKEKQALVISKIMLESSFSVEKSIGFIKSKCK